MAPVFGASSGQKSIGNLKNDQAIFRLGGQVYFISDLRDAQSSLNVLSCLSNAAFLDKYLGRDWKLLKSANLEAVLSDKIAASEFEPFVSLERLRNSVLSRGKDTLNKKELLSLGKRCGARSWDSFKVNEKAILLIEIYLRDRFTQSDSLMSSLGELKKGLKLKDKHEFFSFRPSRSLIEAKVLAKQNNEISEDKDIESSPEKIEYQNRPSRGDSPSYRP